MQAKYGDYRRARPFGGFVVEVPNGSGTLVDTKDKQGRKRDPDRPELSEQGLFRTPVDIAPEAVPVGNVGNSVGKIVGNSSNNQIKSHTPKIPRQELVAEYDADYIPPVTAIDHCKPSSSSSNAVFAAARDDAAHHDDDSSDDDEVDVMPRRPGHVTTQHYIIWDETEYSDEYFQCGDAAAAAMLDVHDSDANLRDDDCFDGAADCCDAAADAHDAASDAHDAAADAHDAAADAHAAAVEAHDAANNAGGMQRGDLALYSLHPLPVRIADATTF